PQERRSPDAGGEGSVVKIGSAENLDTTQAMQIRMNLQQLFTMDAKTARRFLDRWNAWVQVCDLGPMKRLAKTIMAKAEGILRSIAHRPFQRRPRSHQRQRAGRQAQGQRLPNQAKSQSRRLPHRRRRSGQFTHLK